MPSSISFRLRGVERRQVQKAAIVTKRACATPPRSKGQTRCESEPRERGVDRPLISTSAGPSPTL